MALRPNDPMLMAGYADSVAVKNKGAVVAGTASATSPPPPINSAGVANASVSGTVSLAPSTAKMAGPEDTVFIIARSAQGERVPLAVLRKQVKDLPLRFTLDDSMAMSLQNRLSGATQVVVSARISKSGQAMPQSGDLAGQAAPVTVGTSGVAIEIRDLVK
jgi:cytochrome c-type biogenesis protein CcmH